MEKKEDFNKLLIEPYQEEIYILLLNMCGNPEAAKDIRQSVYERAWKYFSSLRSRDKAGNWLFTIARNELREYYRIRGSYDRYGKEMLFEDDSFEEMVGETKDVIFDIVQKEDAECLYNTVETLRELYRSVIKMYYLMEFSTKEISEILEKSEGNIRVMRHRGLDMMRDKLGKGGQFDERKICR